MREYSLVQVLVHNVPYAVMIGLGAAVLALGLGLSPWAWVAGGAYVACGAAGALWIIIFLCPHCGSYGRRTCPCGYGRIAALLRPKQPAGQFSEKFKKHIPVIVPLWLIPLGVVVSMAASRFSWWLVGLLVAFALVGFVVLPVLSARRGCVACPQRHECVWMRRVRSERVSKRAGEP